MNEPHIAPIAEDVTAPAVALRGLSKNFGKQIAVRNLSLDIPRGSFFGIVGPNGAGKTTALTMATGLLRPGAGNAWIDGHKVWEGEGYLAKQSYGLLADSMPVFDRLSGTEYLQFLGALRGMDLETVKSRSESLLNALDLQDAGSKFIADYSAGMTKKILLAGAMLHRPEVLILDEPLEAVDPVSARTIRQMLQAYVQAGRTVVMSSHVMEVIEGLCSHVAIIADGSVRASGTLNEVRMQGSLSDTFIELVGARDIDESSLGWLR
ncbi:ABC transporter ATP-binding protein [Corynebacterium gerontici]|nr:ABC transporter ATP-binding protein [Corynebacterium gerontici]